MSDRENELIWASLARKEPAIAELVYGNWKHTPECEENLRLVYEPWVEKWPKYCGDCGGAGRFHDWGDMYTPPSDEPCDMCTCIGVCARCGERGLTEDGEGPCSRCGWNYDDAIPYKCICPDDYE